MKTLAKFTATILTLSLSAVSASAQTITFEDLSPTIIGTNGSFDAQLGNTCTQSAPKAALVGGNYMGFKFGTALYQSQVGDLGWGCSTTTDPALSVTAPTGVGGTKYGFTYGARQSLFIDFNSSVSFTSARFAKLSNDPVFSQYNTNTMTIIGYDGLNNIIGTTSALALTNAFQTINWTFGNVQAVEFRGDLAGIFAVDDIVLNAGNANDEPGVVPEPSTYALMAAGLLAMAGIARRRRAA